MQLSELDWAYVQERAAYFTGRGWVFARLDQFLHGPPGVFLLLGEPGTGKTAVATQLALAAAGRLTPGVAGAAPRRAVPVAAAYFCRAGRVDLLDAAQRLSDQLAEVVPGFAQARQATLVPEIQVGNVQVRTGDIAAGGSATGVHIDLSRLQAETAFVRAVTLPLERVREAGESAQVVLLVDALDESLASQTAKELPRLLGDVEYAHLVVTARPDRRATGWLWERAVRVDLLADAPPDSDDVLEYLQRRLTPEGEPAAMAVLAQRIAEQASGNFLYAFYVIEALRGAHVLAAFDDAAARGVPLPEGGLTEVYRDFLRRELWRDDRAWSTRFGPVLAPLAVAQDEGLTTEQLRSVAGRLAEEPMTRTAVREVTRTARQFLDGPAPDGPFRVYHQSFADFLVDPEQNPDFLIDTAETHEAIVAAYAATDPLSWDSYARRNLALHASEVGQLDHLLEDARFLVAADPAGLFAALQRPGQPTTGNAQIYRNAYPHLSPGADMAGERASYLQLAARRHRARLADQLDQLPLRQRWAARWVRGQQPQTHYIVGRHDGGVTAVAVGALPDGTPVIVSGGDDGTVRVWDLESGDPVLGPLTGHDGGVTAVAVGALPDGTPVIVSGSDDGTVRVWDLESGDPVLGPLTGHDGVVRAVAAGVRQGLPVIVSGGDDGTVRVWDLESGDPVLGPLTGHDGGVTAVAAGVRQGLPVIVSGGRDRTVRVWDLESGDPVLGPLTGHDRVFAVAAGVRQGRPVIVSGDAYGAVRVWDLESGKPVLGPLINHDGEVWAVAAGVRQGLPVIVSSSGDRVGVWDLESGDPVLGPLTGHDGGVTAVAAGALPDGTPVIVSGSWDRTVRVWDLESGDPVLGPLTGHDGGVTAVAAGVRQGLPVIVSVHGFGTVRVWDLESGDPVLGPLTGIVVTAVAVGALPDGTPVIVSGSWDRTVRVWDLESGDPVLGPLTGHDGVVRAVAAGVRQGLPVIVSGGDDGAVRVWDLESGDPVLGPLTGHDGGVTAVAVGALPDGTPVIVSGSDDRTVRVWRLADGTPVGKPLTGHDGGVTAVAAGVRQGLPVIVSGGRDRTVRVWRLPDGTPVGKPLTGHEDGVTAVAAGALPDGTPVIVSGSDDQTVRAWDLESERPTALRIELQHRTRAVASTADQLVIGTRGELLRIDFL